MATIIGTIGLYEALLAEGYALPEHCADIRIDMGVDTAVTLTFTQYVTDEDLAKLGRAMARMAGQPVESAPMPTPTFRPTRRIRVPR